MHKVSQYKETIKITDLIHHKKYKIINCKEVQTKFGRSIILTLKDLDSADSVEEFSAFLPKR